LSEPRNVVLLGFAEGLENAIAGLLARRAYTVHRTRTVPDALDVLRMVPAEFVIASPRCAPPAVLEVVSALGEPRTTRVVVLLAGRDVENERRYRAAGLKHILTMPVTATELLRAGSPAHGVQT
jgi:hypothetical protein